MRISIEKTDPGFRRWAEISARYAVGVTLDGVEQSKVLTADELTREVKRYATDRDGNLVLNGDEVETETLQGFVKIHLTPKH